MKLTRKAIPSPKEDPAKSSTKRTLGLKIERFIKEPPIIAGLLGVSIGTLQDMKRQREITYRRVRNKWGWGCTEEDIRDYTNSHCVLSLDKKNRKTK